MAIHPVGPLPASTYWLRRAALLLGVIVLLLVARSCVGGDDPKKPTSTKPTPTTAPTTTRPTSSSPQPCADSALSVTTDTDDETYAVGAKPKLTLTVKNTSTTACTRDIGGGVVELKVMSGEDRVWSSDDCSPSTVKDVVTLAPGATKSVTIAWSARRSKPACAGDRDQVKAGTYRLTARVGTAQSAQAVFRFHA